MNLKTTNRALKCAAAVLVASLVFGLSGTAQATGLPFGAPLVDNVAIPTIYGDNVASASQDGYTYTNGGEGFTPHVTVDFPGGASTGLVGWAATGWTPLVGVAYPPTAGAGTVTMVFQAAAGYQVQLLDFNVANWDPPTETFETIQVLNSLGVPLATATNVTVPTGTGILTQANVFGATIFKDTKLTLNFIDNPGALDNIAFDNIKFSEAQSAVVPEPSTFVLAAVGLLGLVAWGRRRRA